MRFKVAKGAPQAIFDLAGSAAMRVAARGTSRRAISASGFRTLGVARTDAAGTWRFLGLLPLFDPPRDDCAATIATTREIGLDVKMVTGDHVAIAREIAGKLELGRNILSARQVFGETRQG